MTNQPVTTTIFRLIGFSIIIYLLLTVLGGILGFAFHILLPMGLAFLLFRLLFNKNKVSTHYHN
ncbi:hypothetical protein OL234_00680 [Vagococcus intermedius]|uniref:Uncharacterized protein n=2 Tax=Vagococcus intermedius TaxID=2991418 RepID=A0AAF0I810_9ENTE|nr:hypothetical protein [Vagococcus intermedius]WEG73456.1 hypothetical protein OL234_00680 [Vagococcus intermedius]